MKIFFFPQVRKKGNFHSLMREWRFLNLGSRADAVPERQWLRLLYRDLFRGEGWCSGRGMGPKGAARTQMLPLSLCPDCPQPSASALNWEAWLNSSAHCPQAEVLPQWFHAWNSGLKSQVQGLYLRHPMSKRYWTLLPTIGLQSQLLTAPRINLVNSSVCLSMPM